MPLAVREIEKIRTSDPYIYSALQAIIDGINGLEEAAGVDAFGPGSGGRGPGDGGPGPRPRNDPPGPGAPEGGTPAAPTVVVLALGLGITFSMAPPVDAKNYTSLRQYKVRIYTDAERTTLAFPAVMTPDIPPAPFNRGRQLFVTVQEPGTYYYSVTAINNVGEGKAKNGTVTVSGVSKAAEDGAPSAPSVALKGTVMAGDQAVFTLTRPATGFKQIGVYTIVARDNATFDWLYSDSPFVGAVTQGSAIITSDTGIFTPADVGKVIELTGLIFNEVTGITDYRRIDEYLSPTQVRGHTAWNGDSANNLVCRYGTAWWDDSNYLHHENIYVQGPNAIEAIGRESFEFLVPYEGKTIYVAAYAGSVYGISPWSASASVTTTDRIGKAAKGLGPPVLSGSEFTATNNRRVAWTSGTIKYGDGTTEAVNSGNTGTLPANVTRWIYKILGNATLQVTSNVLDATGSDRVPVAIIRTKTRSSEKADITTVMATDYGLFTTLSAFAVDAGELTAGTLTGMLIRTSSSGKRVEISSADTLDFYDSGGIKVSDIDVVSGKVTWSVSEGLNLNIGSALGTFSISVGSVPTPVLAQFGISIVNLFQPLSMNGDAISNVGDLECDSITKDGTGDILFNDRIDMGGRDILNVGDLECDSITKDGTGDILFNDRIDMGGRDILNVGDLECDSITKDGSGDILFNDRIDMGGRDILNVGDLECDSITKDGSGDILFNDRIDMGGRDILNVGEVELDSISADGTRIEVNDDMRFASGVDLDLRTNNAKFFPRYYSQSTAPTPAAGEIALWNDTGNSTINWVYYDGSTKFIWTHDSTV